MREIERSASAARGGGATQKSSKEGTYGIGDGDGDVLGLLVVPLDTILPRSVVSIVSNHFAAIVETIIRYVNFSFTIPIASIIQPLSSSPEQCCRDSNNKFMKMRIEIGRQRNETKPLQTDAA